jgi:hypothetical protein
MRNFPKYKGPIQYINQTPYQICAVYPIDRVKDTIAIKDWLECDTVFKNNREGVYYFCDKIQDVLYEII